MDGAQHRAVCAVICTQTVTLPHHKTDLFCHIFAVQFEEVVRGADVTTKSRPNEKKKNYAVKTACADFSNQKLNAVSLAASELMSNKSEYVFEHINNKI